MTPEAETGQGREAVRGLVEEGDARTAHIVYAHPEPNSFVSAMRDVTRLALERAGWRVEVSDLYALGFNPVAGPADFPARANPDYLVYALEQRNAVATDS